MQERFNHAIAHNKMRKKLVHKEFRLQLARDFTGTYTACQTIGKPSHAEPIGCFTDRHFLIDLGSTAACDHCSNKCKLTRFKFGCGPCGNIHLCFGPYLTR